MCIDKIFYTKEWVSLSSKHTHRDHYQTNEVHHLHEHAIKKYSPLFYFSCWLLLMKDCLMMSQRILDHKPNQHGFQWEHNSSGSAAAANDGEKRSFWTCEEQHRTQASAPPASPSPSPPLPSTASLPNINHHPCCCCRRWSVTQVWRSAIQVVFGRRRIVTVTIQR